MSEMKHEILEQYFAHNSVLGSANDSRRRFLSIAGRVAGLGTVAMASVAQTGTGASSPSAGDNIDILQYALTLEFLEATFYAQFLGAGAPPTGQTSLTGLIGSVTGNPPAFTATDLAGASVFQGFPATFGTGLFSLLTQIRDHEAAHVAALIATIRTLGGTPTQPCTYTFPVVTIDDFLKTAQALENTGVAAYDGAINKITDPGLVQTSATIATVEARHASFLNLIAGGGLASGNFQPVAPGAAAPAVPGVSASPFPNAFDMPLSMAQVLQIAGPFLASCPVPLQQTSVVVAATPVASSTSPFSAAQITLDLSRSLSGTGQSLRSFSFSIPANAKSFCPSSLGGSSCPLIPAILQRANSPTAIIQFVSGSGFYPIQVSATDSGGRTSTQVILLAYQAPGGPTLPSGTPGLTMLNTTPGGTP
ncbi:MAG: ferritin-like domain-containing protein [Bryobacteraceae bacterium]